MTDDFRRVVTAVDGDGHSVVDSDGLPPVVISPRHPDQFLTAIWAVDELPTSYTAPGPSRPGRLQAVAGGWRVEHHPKQAAARLDGVRGRQRPTPTGG